MTDILGPASDAFAVTSRPTDPRALGLLDTFFQDCSSPTAGDGTDISAAFLNSVVGNLRTLARANGTTAANTPVVPMDNSDGMLTAAVIQLAQRGLYARAVDTGAVNALSVALTPTPVELVDGMEIQVKPIATNTGASTIRVLGQVFPVVTRLGAALSGGELIGGAWQKLSFDAFNGRFQVISFAAALPPSDASLCHNGSATAAGVAAAYVCALTPGVAAAVAGLWFRVPITVTNTGPSTIDFGFGAKPIVVNRNLLALRGGEMPGGIGFIADFLYDGSNARLLNPVGLSPVNPRYIFGSTTVTPTPGYRTANSWTTGGGAGGGGNSGSNTGPGGGAAETIPKFWPNWGTVGPIPFVAGAPGLGGDGTASNAPSGGDGGDSTFGPVIAKGGKGGTCRQGYYAGPGGAGGQGGSGGDTSIPGGSGASAVGFGSGSNVNPCGGNGGASYYGGGGRGGQTYGSGVVMNGETAKTFGAGGGGSDGDASGKGGDGGPPLLYIEEYV